jgi:hypothetical protein
MTCFHDTTLQSALGRSFFLPLVTNTPLPLLHPLNHDSYQEDLATFFPSFFPSLSLNTTNIRQRPHSTMAFSRQPSVRQLAKKLCEPVANDKQASIEDSLDEILDQDDAGSADAAPLPKASKPASKRKAPVKKASTAKPRSQASRKVATASVPSPGQDAASLESPDEQSRKRNTSDADLEETPFKKVSTRDDDQGSVSSELSVLGATPEHPDLLGDDSLDNQLTVASEDPNLDVKATIDSTPAIPSTIDENHNLPSDRLEINVLPDLAPAPEVSSSLANDAIESLASPPAKTDLVAPVGEDGGEQMPSGSVAESTEVAPPTPVEPASLSRMVRLKLWPQGLPAISQSAPSPALSLASQDTSDPAASLPTPTSARQCSARTFKPPVRFREPAAALPESIEEDSVDNEQDIDFAGESPTVQKAGRKPRAKPKPKTKVHVSPEKVADDDLANDVKGPTITKAARKRKAATTDDDLVDTVKGPTVTKAARKRKADTAQGAPGNVPVSSEKVTKDDLANDVTTPTVTKAPRKRKTETTQKTPRKKPATPRTKAKAAKASAANIEAPSPFPSQSDLEAEFPIDADLLKLSRAMTHREPLASKPETAGKPEVWAPGRQELCETLPYYKSHHSGCYSNDGTAYAMMFDSVNPGREYMDSDVVISRMGGRMATDDDKPGAIYQTKDHMMKEKQPQSILNNIAHRNPIVIVCGGKNEGAITKMPHRYCVLDWFKITHVWAEKTMSRGQVRITIRYRFERLDRLKESWYRPAPASDSAREWPVDLSLPIHKCAACSKACPQVYLISWLCTDPDCTAFWKLPNGQDAPYGELDYHPAFLQHRVEWERESPPFSLNPGVPQVEKYFGDSLAFVSTRGVVCPDCGRCNIRYKFTHWRCDTVGCKWKLIPQVQVVMPSNLSHTPWDMPSDGPSLTRAQIQPAVKTQVKYYSNYKVTRYTIDGIVGSVTVAKANQHVVSEPGGANDMFRELQTVNVGLERRIMRKTADTEQQYNPDAAVGEVEGADEDEDQPGEAGARMTAFGMNFGMPYKFIATGDSKSFEDAPAAVRAVRSRLNWAQRVFVNDESGYQDFNEELIFAYLEKQKIRYHDDGEEGLGPRIATLSLGAPATMDLRVKAKYFSQVSKTGVFTYEEPLPLALLESCGHTPGYTRKPRANEPQSSVPVSKDTHAARLAAWNELQDLRAKGDTAKFRARSKEIPIELQMKRKETDGPLISVHLTHGDIVIMEGEDIQKFMEHAVEPHGHLRFAMTCRTIKPGHLPPDQLPPYEVLPDAEGYDGATIREDEDGDKTAIVWD